MTMTPPTMLRLFTVRVVMPPTAPKDGTQRRFLTHTYLVLADSEPHAARLAAMRAGERREPLQFTVTPAHVVGGALYQSTDSLIWSEVVGLASRDDAVTLEAGDLT